ncbi:Alanine dehydrogenase [subsurface metagenome]
MDKLKGIQFGDSESVKPTCPEIARGKEILYINRKEIENMGYTQVDLLKLVRMALTEHGKKMVEMPAKIGIHPIYDTFHHAMPAFVPTAEASGIKWVACFPENYKYKLNQFHYINMGKTHTLYLAKVYI